MSEDYLAHVCDGKTGSELFRELMRIYSEVQVEDYFKMGQWQNRAMRTDYVLLEAHRREAGAPAPPPLSEIPEPKVPESKFLSLSGLGGARGGHSNGVPASLASLAANLSAQQGAAGPAAELRNCAIYISRNKLDPSRAKAMLMGLSVENRKLVMEGFTSDKIGMEATDDLDKYIKEHVKSGSGATTPAKAVPPGRVATAAGSFGIEELKQTAQFIARNKLDPTRAKTALMKLSPAQRKAVTESFASASSGMEATEELEQYIAGCQETGFEGVEEEPPAKKAKV
mmetsp:Transcript_1925/g.6030  ORF Transcript_1925/g.6030 Transcript_1925/m.6030 type:complete len:284 (-) Transcript_1925:116-967(-)